MVSNRQRRRALARAKWQRQQARRTQAQRRARTLGIIGGTAAAVVTVILVGWGVVLLVQNGNDTPSQLTPSQHPFPSLQPSITGPTITSFKSDTPTTPTTPTSTTGTSTTGSTKTTGSTSKTHTPSSPTSTTGTGHS